MKRLLAKLPRSSSGSRDASASSSASRCPFDILDVSITEAAVGFCDFALVSAAICFSGASSGVFIKRGSIARMLFQKCAWRKLFIALREPFHFIGNFLQTKMVGEPKRPAAKRREAGSQNHSVVGVFRRLNHVFFQTTRRFVYHEKDEAMRKIDIF